MALVFKTKADGRHVVINGVGTLPAQGRGGISVEEAAAAGLRELQGRDDDGRLVPLTGKELNTAARAFADQAGIEVGTVREEELEGLREARGLPADRPPAEEVSRDIYERLYGSREEEHPEAEAEEVASPTATPEGGEQ